MSKSDYVRFIHTRDAAVAYLCESSAIPRDVVSKLTTAALEGDVKTLATCTGLSSVANNPEAWLALRQVEALYKKNVSFTDEDAATLAAAKTFATCEAKCRRTNKRLLHFVANHPQRMVKRFPLVPEQLRTMRRSIAQLLGPFSDFEESMPNLLRLTPGGTSDRSRRRSVPFLKLTRHIRAPRSAWTMVGDVLRRLGFDECRYAPLQYFDADANRVEFVDKNYGTKRTIALEGTHSMPLQLAFDSYAKQRLLSQWAIDLSSQARGQELSRLGSIDGSYSTIDLKNASDTVAYVLINLLFPREWAEYLIKIRSARWFTRDRLAKSVLGSGGTYAKFSSMGNGSTFCIETIIFAAACIATGSRDFAVYGDDIALEWQCFSPVVKLLGFLGFSPNIAKTFHDDHKSSSLGGFRESCGTDWYRGRAVTPFYLRKEPLSYGDFHLAVNGLVECAIPFGGVWQLCRTWTRDNCSHVVPVNDDSRSGVFVDSSTAYKLKLVKSYTTLNHDGQRVPEWTSFFWGLGLAPGVERKTNGLRPYLLWFFQKPPYEDQREYYLPVGPWDRPSLNWLKRASLGRVVDSRITSTVNSNETDLSTFTGSRRISYFPPSVHRRPWLHAWSDFLYGVQLCGATTRLHWRFIPSSLFGV